MMCPRCSHISFDYLDRCKACGEDLVPTKIKLNIYIKPPEMEIGEDGFAVGKVGGAEQEMLEAGSQEKEQDISMEDILKEDGEELTTFDFGEDKKEEENS